jgi:hypothetical protein
MLEVEDRREPLFERSWGDGDREPPLWGERLCGSSRSLPGVEAREFPPLKGSDLARILLRLRARIMSEGDRDMIKAVILTSIRWTERILSVLRFRPRAEAWLP